MLPAILLILFIFLIPFVYAIVISLTDWNGISKTFNFIGLDNYINMFKEAEILEVLRNNLFYFVEIVVIQNLLAIIIAAMLREKFRGKNFFRAALFLPTVICTVAIGFVWNLILDPINGYLPAFFNLIGLKSLGSVIWLGNTATSLHVISFVNIWQWTGQTMVIYLASMLSVDNSLYEAAGIDGASRFAQFRKITLPMLAPALTINLVTSTIGTLKIYDLPFTMTRGGPGHSSESLAISIYSNSFVYNKMGYGTAISLVLFVFVLIISVVQMRVLRSKEDAIL